MRLELISGDLLKQDVEAIVNAANESLLGGGGIDGIIHRAAGPELLETCKQLPEKRPGVRIDVGEAVVVGSFDIQKTNPAIKYIVQTVGPRYKASEKEKCAKLLAAAYVNSLKAAAAKGIRSIAFPAISCGIFGYPLIEAQKVAKKAVENYLQTHPESFDRVLFVYLSEIFEKICSVT